MKMTTLGDTDIKVSRYCLGSMTWGTTNDIDDGHDQIDAAIDHGINLIDTAEIYPVNPVYAETIGRTERIIGLWFNRDMRRDDVILATSHAGAGVKHLREGRKISSQTIEQVIDGCLRRLKTEYIDLFQFHWPNRGSNNLRNISATEAAAQGKAEIIANMEDCIGALQNEVKKGRIRCFGLSNETAWGLTQWCAVADRMGGPRPVTIQNEYSLMCRQFDTDLAEASVNEKVGLLAYSPLATGLLTGKYRDGNLPAGSRMSAKPNLGGRNTARAHKVVEVYVKIAAKHGLDPVAMALAFVAQRRFTTSVIVGATDLAQLHHALDVSQMTLGEDVISDINKAHKGYPVPF